MRKDATHPARFAQARERATQTLEDEAVRRAVDGVWKPVLYRGKQVYIQGEPLFEIDYSDQFLIRLLEAYNPEKYGRRVEQINLMEINRMSFRRNVRQDCGSSAEESPGGTTPGQ